MFNTVTLYTCFWKVLPHKMDICVFNLVTFVFILTNAWALASRLLNTTIAIEGQDNAEIIKEMGKGLETIPQGSRHVKVLNLAYNHISKLPSHIFKNMSYSSLETINLKENKINNISVNAFKGLKQLQEADLSSNNITTIDTYTFRHNSKLVKLDLSTNRINFRRLQVFLMSDTLETLIITHNKIEQIYELTFMGLPNLKTLMLDHNTIFMVAPNSFKPLVRLQYLSLSNTGVYRLSEAMFPPDSEDLPRIIDIENTPLANKFDPHLTKVKDTSVRSLLILDQHIYITDDSVV